MRKVQRTKLLCRAVTTCLLFTASDLLSHVPCAGYLVPRRFSLRWLRGGAGNSRAVVFAGPFCASWILPASSLRRISIRSQRAKEKVLLAASSLRTGAPSTAWDEPLNYIRPALPGRYKLSRALFCGEIHHLLVEHESDVPGKVATRTIQL